MERLGKWRDESTQRCWRFLFFFVFFSANVDNGMQIKSCWHLDWNVMTCVQSARITTSKPNDYDIDVILFFWMKNWEVKVRQQQLDLRESLGRENTTWTTPPYHIKYPPKKQKTTSSFSTISQPPITSYCYYFLTFIRRNTENKKIRKGRNNKDIKTTISSQWWTYGEIVGKVITRQKTKKKGHPVNEPHFLKFFLSSQCWNVLLLLLLFLPW